MIARGFKSVIWVATVGGAALCCYMVSLRVATERADLAKVESQIIAAKRDIRSLQTELGTRGRLTQLEQWNSDVLALSAPTSAQFVKDEVTLASLQRHDRTVEEQSENIRMASAEAPAATPAPAAKPAPEPKLLPAIAPAPAQPPLVHHASYTPAQVAAETKKVPATPKPAKAAADPTKSEQTAAAKPAKPEPSPATKPTKLEQSASAKPAKPKLTETAAPARTPAKPAETKPVKVASAADPKRPAPAKPAASRPAKRQGSAGN